MSAALNNSTTSTDPGELASVLGEIIRTENDVQMVKYVTVSSLTLLLYDIFLTLAREREYIWSKRFSGGTALYYLIRYGNLIFMAVNTVYYVWEEAPLEFCKVYFYIGDWLSFSLVIPITVFLTFRTYATFSRNSKAKWLLAALVILCDLGLISSLILSNFQASFHPLPLPGLTCAFDAVGISRTASMITYISSTVFDFVIFVATVGRLYHLFRLGKTRLVRVILRDTLWYFLILFSEALASLLLYVFLPASHAALAALLLNHTHALSVVIVARIILNLREVLMSGISIDTLTAPPGEYDSSGEEPGSGEPWPGSLVFAPCAPEAVSRCEQIELGEIHWPKV